MLRPGVQGCLGVSAGLRCARWASLLASAAFYCAKPLCLALDRQPDTASFYLKTGRMPCVLDVWGQPSKHDICASGFIRLLTKLARE